MPRKTSSELLDEIVIDQILYQTDKRRLIEDYVDNVRNGTAEDYKSFKELVKLIEEYPELTTYIIKELLKIHDSIILESELTDEAFDKQLTKLEEL